MPSRCAATIAALLFAACADDGVTAVTVAQLRFVEQPANITAGQAFSVSVELLDANGNRATSARDPVTMSLSAESAVTGPAVVAATRGLATFGGLSITAAGADVKLTARAAGAEVSSISFSIVPGAVASQRTTLAPDIVSVAPGEPVALTYSFRDAHGNLIGAAPVALTTILAGATFTPGAGVTTDSGTFTTTFSAPTGGAAPIVATVAGHAATVSPAFSVCVPTPLVVPAVTPATLAAGECVAAGQPRTLFALVRPTGGAVSFAITSGFATTVEVTPEPPAQTIVVRPASGAPVEWLLPAGTYQVRIGGVSSTGPFSMTTGAHPGNTGCVQRHLAGAGTFPGQQLGEGDCPLGDGTYYDAYAIHSARPCTFRLSSLQFTPFLWLLEEGGGNINSALGSGPGFDAVMGLPACKYINGPLILWTNSDFGETGGNYTLTVTFTGPAPAGIVDSARVIRVAVPPSADLLRRILAIKRVRQSQ